VGRPDKVRSASLDASALLGVITGDPDFACLKSLLAAVDRGEVRLVESSAMLTEVRPRHARDTSARAYARQTVLELLESPETSLVDVSTVVARKAGDLAAEHNLKTWDAVHLATAILSGADVLVVRDGRFPKGDVEGVWVTEPFDLNEDNLLGLLPPDDA
jgi:predicted nucleic acid-binding protein